MKNLFQHVSQAKTKRFSLVIVRNFEIIELINSGNSIDVHTKFQAASLSKTITSVISLILVEQKLLKLSDIKELLSHSAGISVSGFDGYKQGQKIPSLSQILEGIPPANSPKIFQKYKPGKYRYSGGGYMILQKIIEDVTGKSFSDIANEFVFKPLGMKESTFKLIKGDKRDYVYPEIAAAGLWTAPTDMSKLLIEIGLALKGEGKILSKKSAQLMLKEHIPGVGLGTFVHKTRDRIQFTHDGANFGYRARYVFFSNGNGVVVMTKSNDFKFIDRVIRVTGKEYGWGKFKVKI